MLGNVASMLLLSANLSIKLSLIVSILAGVCVSSRAVGWLEAEVVASGFGCDLGRAIGDLGIPLAGGADVPLLLVDNGGVCATMDFLKWLLSKGIG